MAPTRNQGAVVKGRASAASEQILVPEAVAFIVELARRFNGQREELLARRRMRQARFDRGEAPDFLAETRQVREGDWVVDPLPADLLDRRVEITGPVDRKMIINALNSGASVFMADFEDANSPTWDNVIRGQQNLWDAVRRRISYSDPQSGKAYALNDKVATLMVRPRGWHLPERHLEVDGKPVSASLFDFGLHLFHNGAELLSRGSGPYFYLPKLESHLEARLWNDVFVWSEERLGLPRGAIKATVLIETLPAAFEMDEILYELRQHSAGLNCGRWDYIFSLIKTFRARPEFVLPDRIQVTMEQPCMRAYTQLAIKTCHRRKVHAIGGMAANIPVKSDEERNRRALDKVKQDKLREVRDGHDGTWVAHPGLVPLAREIFDAHMPKQNQIDRLREDVQVSREDLLVVPQGTATVAGLRHNIDVGLQYLAAWFSGLGCVPLYDLMEDAATAEISRTQVWQWLHHRAALDGEPLTAERFRAVLREEVEKLRKSSQAARPGVPTLELAEKLFEKLSTAEVCADFLTLPAYDQLLEIEGG